MKTASSSDARPRWLWRFVRHLTACGKRGTFTCARGLTHQCVIRGIIYDSPFHAELAYRIDYTIADTGSLVRNAEIPIESFRSNVPDQPRGK